MSLTHRQLMKMGEAMNDLNSTYLDLSADAVIAPQAEHLPATLKPTMKEIKISVARAAGIPFEMLEDASRKRIYAQPRQVAIYLCCVMTGASLNQVARQFGNRDHTTILFAKRKIAAARRANADVQDMLKSLKTQILEEASKRAPPPGEPVSVFQAVRESLQLAAA